MCYFHVMKNCKEKLRSYSKDVQNEVLQDVHKLHSCISLQDSQQLMNNLYGRWTARVPEFYTYFVNQWMVNDSFGNWEVYCSHPGELVV